MAILNGPNDDHFRGKLGGYAIYDLNGQIIKRKIGTRVKPYSALEIANHKTMADMTALLKPVKEFIEVGFENAGRSQRKTPYNMAYSVNYHSALIGDHPNKVIDFKKVLFSKGDMPLTENLLAELTDEGISFSWNPDLTNPGFKANDRAMFMAYLPQKHFGVFQLSGARRSQGKELLALPASKRTVTVETYISFISANHKSISDSFYTGQFNWKSL